MFDKDKIPKLPYGQGSMYVFNDKFLAYKKSIKTPNGKKVLKIVYGETPKICMEKMAEVERNQIKHNKDQSKITLYDGIIAWLNTTHKSTVKTQTMQRLNGTAKNQIEPSKIGRERYQSVTPDEIQELITELVDKEYSYSTVKKTYDLLNAFYRYASAKDHFDNPMLLVSVPRKSNIKSKSKTVQWFDQEDIDAFTKACESTWLNGRLKYKYGRMLAANFYLGMRGGELLALQWKDIDLDGGNVYVSKTLIEYVNKEGKTVFEVQPSTKRDKNRLVPINSKCRTLLEAYKASCEFTEPDDYVISTSNRKTNTLKNLSDTIKCIEEEAGTKVRANNTHILRHTCASLYFRAGVPIETICAILGNSREVCEKTYIHFVEEQLKNAASKTIQAIEI